MFIEKGVNPLTNIHTDEKSVTHTNTTEKYKLGLNTLWASLAAIVIIISLAYFSTFNVINLFEVIKNLLTATATNKEVFFGILNAIVVYGYFLLTKYALRVLFAIGFKKHMINITTIENLTENLK
jgi:hypothetical protein